MSMNSPSVFKVACFGRRQHKTHTASGKTVSWFMLILFLMGLGASGFNSNGLAHELDHDRQMLDLAADHDHAPQPGDEGIDPERLSDSEHRLTHFSSLLQPLPISSIVNYFGESPARSAPSPLRLSAVPSAPAEPPFRPPRVSTRI